MPVARRQYPYYLAFPAPRSIRGNLGGSPPEAERGAPKGRAQAFEPGYPAASSTSPANTALRLAAYLRAIDR
jgi:hypothetical protein